MTRARTAAFSVAATIVGVGLLEVLAALVLWFVEPPLQRESRLRGHTRYDPELGWVNTSDRTVPDLYGPGGTLTTNARGFRSVRETDDAVRDGTVRILCSGDSFTLGYGVADAETWPACLEREDSRIESVNLGQAGYGVDQSYLLARRECPRLGAQIHLFAAIAEDFTRVRYDEFRGYGKPVLALDGNTPVATGVPVARPGRPGGPLERIHLYRALRRLLGRDPARPVPVLPMSRATALAVRAITVLSRAEETRGVHFAFVWLPTSDDYLPDEERDRLRKVVLQHLQVDGIDVIDLTSELRSLDASSAERLFLPAETDAGRHFSPQGNARAARLLLGEVRKRGWLEGTVP